ncbi:MAG: TlpA disulfide reductase family protein [Gemmatimonadaceae bacterium]
MNTIARSLRVGSLVAAGLVAALGTAPSAGAQDMGIKVGTIAPSAAVVAMNGKPMDLADFYGDKPVVLEFWATWCPLCRKLEPAMRAARRKHAGKVTFVSVGVSSNQTRKRQVAHATKQKMGGAFVFDRDDMAAKAFAVPHTSYVVVIDRNRKVVYTGVGDAQDIEAALRMAAIE